MSSHTPSPSEPSLDETSTPSIHGLMVPSYLSQSNSTTKGGSPDRFEQDILSESDEELECSVSPNTKPPPRETVPQRTATTISWQPSEDRAILFAAQKNTNSELPGAWSRLSKETGKS